MNICVGINHMWNNFKKMPFLLKLITLNAMICFLFLPGALLPHGSFFAEGISFTEKEWWTSEEGLIPALMGMTLPICGILLLNKTSKAREIYVGVLIAFSLGSVIFPPYDQLTQIKFVALLVFISIIAWYLFYKRSVIEYFSSSNGIKSQPH